MSTQPLTDEQYNGLLRVIRETIRQEIRAEFEGRKAMAEPAGAVRSDNPFYVPTHVAGTPV